MADGEWRQTRRDSRPFRGTAAERAAQDWLEAEGWVVHRAQRSGFTVNGRYIPRSNDVWDCIDLIGMRKDRGFVFVQVGTAVGSSGRKSYETQANITHKKRDIESLPWPPGSRVLLIGAVTRKNDTPLPGVSRYFQVWVLDTERGTWMKDDAVIRVRGPGPDPMKHAGFVL